MTKNLQKIQEFLAEHHVLNLATCRDNELSTCSLFYAYDTSTNSFVVASSEDTLHVEHAKQNKYIAGTIVLETKTVGKIQGVQYRGEFTELQDKKLKQLYFKTFPYALVMNPTLWQIKVTYFKMTDNKLGFGKKLIWQATSQ